MTALGSQTIASSYEQLLHVDRDGGGDTANHVSVKDGDNETTFGFTIASDALMMSSTNRLEFGDTGTYIYQSTDGQLDLVADTEIQIAATTIDMNGAVDISGNTTVVGNLYLYDVGNEYIAGDGTNLNLYATNPGTIYLRNSGSSYVAFGNDLTYPATNEGHALGTDNQEFSELWAADTSINTGSDRRLKDNIQELPSGSLDKILQLKPSTYDFKQHSQGSLGIDNETITTQARANCTGFIAQEVEPIFPEMIRKNKSSSDVVDGDGGVLIPKDEDRYSIAINGNEMIAHLVKAVQELSAKVEALEG